MALPAEFGRDMPHPIGGHGIAAWDSKESPTEKAPAEQFAQYRRAIVGLSEFTDSNQVFSPEATYEVLWRNATIAVGKKTIDGQVVRTEVIVGEMPSSTDPLFKKFEGFSSPTHRFVRQVEDAPDSSQFALRMGELLGEIHGLVFPEQPGSTPTYFHNR